MLCKRCRTVMGCTQREEHPQSVQAWYACPVCRRRELVSQPLERGAGWVVGSRWLACAGQATSRRALLAHGLRG
jgi:hypothetical protein